MITCVICNSSLSNCKERRILYSKESCHVVSTAVELLRECVPNGTDMPSLESKVFRSTITSYICKRPCFTALERIQKIEREAEELRVVKMKATHRAELRKRQSQSATSDDTIVRPALVATPAKKRLIFTTPAQCSPVLAVSL